MGFSVLAFTAKVLPIAIKSSVWAACLGVEHVRSRVLVEKGLGEKRLSAQPEKPLSASSDEGPGKFSWDDRPTTRFALGGLSVRRVAMQGLDDRLIR